MPASLTARVSIIGAVIAVTIALLTLSWELFEGMRRDRIALVMEFTERVTVLECILEIRDCQPREPTP